MRVHAGHGSKGTKAVTTSTQRPTRTTQMQAAHEKGATRGQLAGSLPTCQAHPQGAVG